MITRACAMLFLLLSRTMDHKIKKTCFWVELFQSMRPTRISGFLDMISEAHLVLDQNKWPIGFCLRIISYDGCIARVVYSEDV